MPELAEGDRGDRQDDRDHDPPPGRQVLAGADLEGEATTRPVAPGDDDRPVVTVRTPPRTTMATAPTTAIATAMATPRATEADSSDRAASAAAAARASSAAR